MRRIRWLRPGLLRNAVTTVASASLESELAKASAKLANPNFVHACAGSRGSRKERERIAAFGATLEKLKPQLVSLQVRD